MWHGREMDVRSIALLVGLALGLGCQINSGGVGTGGGSAGVGTETGQGGTTLPPVLTDDGGTTTPGGTTEPPPGTGSDGTTGLDGSSSGSGDTGDPMLPRPDPYGVAVPLTELNDALGAADDDPTLRQDQREIYFASTRLGDEDIFVATRASVDVPFDTPMIVGGNISTFSQETTPELSRDGTLLLFASDRRGNGLEIYYTTRASMASLSWALPQPLPALSSMAHESAATPQRDQATLLFCSDRMPTDGGADIWRAAFDPGTVMVSDLQRVAELARDPRLLGRVRQILGSEAYIHQSRVNFKPGLRGKEFYWHSDFETWHFEDGMPEMRAVSVSINLTENRADNGSLMVMPGSHRTFVGCVGETPQEHYRESLRSQHYGVPSDRALEQLASAHGITQVVAPPGSALLFDSNCMHGSNGNITPYPRRNLFLVFNSVENTLVAPFGGTEPRPGHIASRDPVPLG